MLNNTTQNQTAWAGEPAHPTAVRLEVSADGVVGCMEVPVKGEAKHRSSERDILSRDKEQARQDLMDRMCG